MFPFVRKLIVLENKYTLHEQFDWGCKPPEQCDVLVTDILTAKATHAPASDTLGQYL